VLFSADAEADRRFFQDVLELGSVDAGGGWLIFALPPAEAAVHPGDGPGSELYLMCDDVAAEIARLDDRGVRCSEIEDAGWGSVVKISLPSGAEIGLYQPRHPTMVERAAD
jgi:hypothetical protein